MAAEAEDRTEAPSAKRREEARAEGRVALSREAVTLSGLLAGFGMLAFTGGSAASALVLRLRPLLEGRFRPVAALEAAGGAFAWAALPMALAACLASVASVLAQTGLLVRPGALRPDPARLNPARGAAHLFGRGNLVETGKALARLGVLGVASWTGVRDALPAIGTASLSDPAALPSILAGVAWRVALPVLVAAGLLAGLDLFLAHRKHLRSLRMSREEMKQEAREADGDPRVKARLRKLRATRARARMMTKVPTATVVVTNPTHYAVALAFDRAKREAPRVVAKGADEVAARIRDVARAHSVPLVSNPPLARALFRLELETEIPAEHFAAVAEIIAYVWRLRGRVRAS